MTVGSPATMSASDYLNLASRWLGTWHQLPLIGSPLRRCALVRRRESAISKNRPRSGRISAN